jgi:hypothetical protein
MAQYNVDLNVYVTVEAKDAESAWEKVNNNPTIIEAIRTILEAAPLGGDFEIGEPEEAD